MTAAPGTNSGVNLYGIGVGTASTGILGLGVFQSPNSPTQYNINGPGGEFKIGQFWLNTTSGGLYYLQSFSSVGGTVTATWTQLESSGGSGSFTTLTSTGATTLATTGASVNTFGNTTGSTSVGILAGSGGINLTGAVTSANGITITNGNLSLGTAGNKVSITTGSNASIGQSGAMTSGTITIDTTAVDTNSLIFLTNASPGGTVGTLSVGTITTGTSFVINSSSSSDTSKVNWWIIN